MRPDQTASNKGNHLPSPAQTLLLKTILGPSEQLIENWQRWQQAVALDDIDYGSFRIIPMLYHTLRQHGAEGPDLARYAGMTRKAWYENKLIFHRTNQFIQQWQSEGHDFAMLKGYALAHLYYPDPALRPMADADILVPLDQAIPSINWFFERGWLHTEGVSQESLVKYSIHKVHSADMKHPSGLTVDAHWQLIHPPMPPDLTKELWNAMQTVTINGLSVKTLGPTDQLFHTCFHGFSWNEVPPLRWIIDAHQILQKDGTKIDWARLERFAIQCHVTPIIGAALAYLKNEFNEPIPADVIDRLNQQPWLDWQKTEHQIWVAPTPRSYLNYYLHDRYKRLQATLPEWRAKSRWRAQCDYLKLHWELDSNGQLFRQLVHRAWDKLWLRIRG